MKLLLLVSSSDLRKFNDRKYDQNLSYNQHQYYDDKRKSHQSDLSIQILEISGDRRSFLKNLK